MTDDFYDLLGVSQDASQDEIRSAFRKQVREYHPDLNDDPRAPAQFTALKKAYDTLGDPKERDDYDRMGHDSYVTKRINGLPSPDEWDIPEREYAGNGAVSDSQSGGETTAAGGATGKTTGTTRSDTRSGSRSSSGRARNTGTRTDNSTRTSRSSNGDRTPGSSASHRSSTATGHSRGNGTGSSSATSPLGDRVQRRIRWLQRVSLGWPLILLSDALYVAGMLLYFSANATAVARLVDRLVAAVGGSGAVSAVLATRGGVPPLTEYIVSNVAGEGSVGGPLLILGMAFIPSVYFFVVRETRKMRTPWQPSYLYVFGAIAPVLGLITNATLRPPGLYVDLACYVLLPLLSIVGLPFSAFLRPRLRRLVRRTVWKVRDS